MISPKRNADGIPLIPDTGQMRIDAEMLEGRHPPFRTEEEIQRIARSLKAWADAVDGLVVVAELSPLWRTND